MDELESAYRAAKRNGQKPRVMLLTNQNNPVGVIYSRSVLEEILKWSRSRSLFVIVDEIYALSVHKEDENFLSVVEIEGGLTSNDLAVVWAMSKDFGGSGLRAGVLMTGNAK